MDFSFVGVLIFNARKNKVFDLMFAEAHDLNKEPDFRTTYLKEIIYRIGTVTTV